jgi:hypothetical protein
MTDQELIQTARQAMEDLWNSNNGKLMDYEQSAYNCLRLLCIRLEEITLIDPPDDAGGVPNLIGVKKIVRAHSTMGIIDANACIPLPYK